MGYEIKFYNILTGELGGVYTTSKNITMSAKELSSNTYFVQAPRRCSFSLYKDSFLEIFYDKDSRKGDLSHYKAVILYDGETVFEGIIRFPVKYIKKTNEMQFTCYDYSFLLQKVSNTKKTIIMDIGYSIQAILEEILQAAQHYFDDNVECFEYELDYSPFGDIDTQAHIYETNYSDFYAEILSYRLLTIIRNIGFIYNDDTDEIQLQMYEHRHYKDDLGNSIFRNRVRRVPLVSGVAGTPTEETSETSWGVFSATIIINPPKTYLNPDNSIYALTEDYAWVLYIEDAIFFDHIKFNDTGYSYNQLLKLILIINDLAIYCEGNILRVVNKNTYNDLPAVEITEGFLSKGPDAIIYKNLDYSFISDMVSGGSGNWDGRDLEEAIKTYYSAFFDKVYMSISGDIAIYVKHIYKDLTLGRRFKYDDVYYKITSINKNYIRDTITIKALNTISDTYMPEEVEK